METIVVLLWELLLCCYGNYMLREYIQLWNNLHLNFKISCKQYSILLKTVPNLNKVHLLPECESVEETLTLSE